MSKKHLFKNFAVLSCAAMLLLSGCQSSPDTAKDSSQTAATNSSAETGAESNTDTKKDTNKDTNGDTDKTANTSAETGDNITVTDARGEISIPANPQKIVDISGNSDILSVLGYKVAGTANSDAYDYTKFPSYLEDVLEGASILGYSMQDTMDVEGIISLEPDLIIISTIQEKMYQQLSEIAPVVMLELAQTDWKEDVKSVAGIMNKTAKADQWLSSYEEKALKIGEEIRSSYGEDTTYLALLASGGQIFIFDKAGIGSILYDDMGLKRPEGMPVQENISLPVVSYEGLAQIDADRILAIGTDEDLASLRENPVWKNMDPVKNGNVLELPSSPYFNQGYSCIGRSLFLDEASSLMEKLK